MKPTIGRIVHYYPESHNGPRKPGYQPNAAIVTRDNGNGSFNLWAFPTGEKVSKSGNVMDIRMGDPAQDTTGRLFCWPPREGGPCTVAGSDAAVSVSPEDAAAARAAQDGGGDTVEIVASEAAAATDAEQAAGATDPTADSEALNNGGDSPPA